MRPKPPCPVCGLLNVTTLGGRTHGKYGYWCNECDMNGTPTEWAQIPPHRITDGADAMVKIIQKSKRYKCKVCGLPKRGHICGQPQPDIGEDELETGYVLSGLLPLPLPNPFGQSIARNSETVRAES